MELYKSKGQHILVAIISIAMLTTLILAIQQAKANGSSTAQNRENIPAPPTLGEYIPIPVVTLRPVSPLNISESFDWTRGHEDQDKIVYIVRRANGNYEEYFFPLDFYGDVKAAMKFEAGDIIVLSAPLVPLESPPVLGEPSPLEHQIHEIVTPYPGPLLDVQISPYPYP